MHPTAQMSIEVVYSEARRTTSGARYQRVTTCSESTSTRCVNNQCFNNNCQIGSEDFATNYTSLDIDGTERFEAEFRFISENNVIAFENSPFTYAPKYGGFCSYGIWKNKNNTWTRKKLGPSSNPSKYWRVVKNNNTGEIDIYLFGGKEGVGGKMEIHNIHSGESRSEYSKFSGMRAEIGDVVSYYSPSGGGYSFY